MKKIHYIIAFVLLGIISYQPVKNIYFESKKLKNEAFLKEYLSDKSFSRSYVKSLPKKLRPDLKNYHDFLMTRDLNTNTVPSEKVLEAIKIKDAKLNSLSYFNRQSEINWTERGPSKQAGRTRALMLDGNFDSNNKVWAAGVSGGLWSITNIESSTGAWTKASDFWDSLNITCIATDPTDANVIYLGTGEKRGHGLKGFGIWKTSDGGANWTQLTSSTGLKYIDTIIVRDEGGIGAVYAGGGRALSEGSYDGINGLQKSTDGGATWTEVLGEISAGSNHHVTDLELDSNNRLIVGTRTNTFNEGGGQIFYTDDGAVFTQLTTDALGTFDRTFVDVSPSDPNILYAMFENATTGYITWLGKSEDGGDTWTQKSIGQDESGNPFGDYQGSMDYWGFLGIDPNDPNTIYAAGALSIHKSTDSGSTWTEVSEWRGTGFSLPYVHADHHNIVFLDSNKILVSNDGGVFLTTDGGNTFTMKNDNMVTTQFYSTAIHPTDENYVLGGAQDNGTWRLDTGGKQEGLEVYGGDGAFTHIDQVDPNYQFTATTYGNIYRSTNGGSSFGLYSNETNSDGTDAGYFINPSVIDGVNKAMYATFDATSILRIKNYTQLADNDFISINLGSGATAYKTSPHTSGVLFVGTASGRIFKITDANTDSYSYSEISPGETNGYISSIDVGQDDNQILITQSNYGIESVYETVSGGGTNGWSRVEGDLPDIPVRWGLYNRDNFNQVAVATEVGVWVSDDITLDEPVWNPSNDGLANVRVDMLAMNTNGALSAGTFGRGQFTSPGFTSTAPLNAAFSLDKTSGTIPLVVNLMDRSTGNPTSWQWNFGDGNSSTDQNPSHTYTVAGSYSITLSVSDGSDTDSVVKTNTIFVTSAQDTLYTEGFEDCWDQNPANGRDNYVWYTSDVNGDTNSAGCYSSSFNNDATGFLSYDEDKGIGFGAAAASNVSWDDWVHSPEIWLRPGVDNYLKFYAKNLNTQYEESFDVMLSTTAGISPGSYDVTLGSETDVDGLWKEYTYDLSQWAGSKIRFAIHHKSQQKYYEFYDYFMVTAGQVSDTGSPQSPGGIEIETTLVGSDTDGDGINDTFTPSESLSLFWNPNAESDIAKYNVYASQTTGFATDSSTLLGEGSASDVNIIIPTELWVDTTGDGSTDTATVGNANYSNVRSFGSVSFIHDSVNDGEQWFYKVSAVDNDGNETISSEFTGILDSVPPTAGTMTVDNLVDGYLKSLTEVSVSVSGFSDNIGIAQYYLLVRDADFNVYGSNYIDVGDDLTLTGLALSDRSAYNVEIAALDFGGNFSDIVDQDISTYVSLLADYDNDSDVDVEDLNTFVNAWPNQGYDESVDIGPASGTAPYLMPTIDGINNIYDISTFSRMWLWTKSQGRTSQDIEVEPIEFDTKVIGNQIIIELPEGITAGRFELSNENSLYTFKASNKEGYLVLENTNDENKYYEFEFGNLSSDDNQLTITVDGAPISNDINFNYQLFSKDGLAGNGMIQLSNPDEFKLYQNYPNPFNNQTTIKYDIPSLMVNMADVDIYIYNTLGKLVRTLEEGDKSVGQYTTVWDGRNDDGEKVSSGVYFYQLRAKVDGQSDFNKSMKMVIVR